MVRARSVRTIRETSAGAGRDHFSPPLAGLQINRHLAFHKRLGNARSLAIERAALVARAVKSSGPTYRYRLQ